jgi:hypothetical protein
VRGDNILSNLITAWNIKSHSTESTDRTELATATKIVERMVAGRRSLRSSIEKFVPRGFGGSNACYRVATLRESESCDK